MCSYYGDQCNISCPGLLSDEDEAIECNGNGSCEESNGSYHCVCTGPLFAGEACEAKCPGTHMDNGAVVMCNGHGTCSDDKCICSKGYYGEDCGQSCPGLLEDAEPLECMATVSATLPHYNASASTRPSNHQIVAPPSLSHLGACTSSSCSPGTCSPSGQCDCPMGFTGPTCSPVCDSATTCSGHGLCNRWPLSPPLPQRQRLRLSRRLLRRPLQPHLSR